MRTAFFRRHNTRPWTGLAVWGLALGALSTNLGGARHCRAVTLLSADIPGLDTRLAPTGDKFIALRQAPSERRLSIPSASAQERPDPVVKVRSTDEFRSAVSQASPGTRILLAPGIYAGGNYFRNVRGEPGKPIVIAAEDPDRPPVFRGSSECLHFSQVAFLEIADLRLEHARINGLNIDDGGKCTEPSHHVVLRRLAIQDIGDKGNNDGIKLSGVVDFRVEECRIERWGTGGGSALDLVGCHRGVIAKNQFRHTDTQGSTGVQAKGGSSRILIRQNRFENAGGRAVNLGGSTDLPFFRPPLTEIGERAEARDIRVEGNTFIGGGTPVAFVGVDGAVVRFNTIIHPTRWALRILQETRSPGFVPSRRGLFLHNLIVFHSSGWAEGGVNVGSETAPETFRFAGNWWFCADHPDQSRPRLPVAETEGAYGVPPLFRDPGVGDFRVEFAPGQPAAGADALPD